MAVPRFAGTSIDSETFNQRIEGLLTGARLAEMSTDSETFDLAGAVGLGFKNATAVVTMKKELGLEPGGECVFGQGERVFVKIGERASDCEFAVRCAQLRRAVGMSAPPVVCRRLTVREDWAGLSAKPSWTDGVNKRLGRLRRSCGESAPLPVLVSGEFAGGANLVTCKGAFRQARDSGLEFLKVLLFRKYVGSADTNARNIMFRVGPSGCAELLSVDETEASKEQLERYAEKGLVTAQAISADLLSAARKALVDDHAAIAAFLRLLATHAPAHVPTGSRLAAVRSQAPFDAESLAVVDSGNREALAALAKKMRLSKE